MTRLPTPPPADDADPPLTQLEAELLGDAYARLHRHFPTEQGSVEMGAIEDAVFGGGQLARRRLQEVGLPRLRTWLTRCIGTLNAAGYFPDAGSLRAFGDVVGRWERESAARERAS